MNNKTVKKAIFPVAGMGTRFLPATKANPKEMLPIVDKPLIQYAVEEAVAAGITELIFVTSSSKRAIEDHFDSNYELEAKLAKAGKETLLAIVRNVLPRGINCAYIRQPDALGLGHAVLCAKPLINNEPFAVLLADDLIDSEHKPCMQQMLEVYHQGCLNVIAVQAVPEYEISNYGIVAVSEPQQALGKIQAIVEKPALKDAPSNLAVVGRYLLQPTIFDHLTEISQGISGEIQLTDAIAELLKNQAIYAWQFAGMRYDCGSKLGYLEATLAYAQKHPEIGASFKARLAKLNTAKSR